MDDNVVVFATTMKVFATTVKYSTTWTKEHRPQMENFVISNWTIILSMYPSMGLPSYNI